MKVGITCGGIGPYATGDFLRLSVQASETAGFTHYLIPDHIVQFAEYPESVYPYAAGSGQDIPDQGDDAPLQFGDDTYANVDPANPFVDPEAAMAWLAAHSSTIEIGTNILVLPQRHPMLLCKSLATIDSFSGGRVVLGVGVGWAKEEFDAVGSDFAARGQRCNESIEALQAIWADGTSSYQGEHFNFKYVFSFPKPVRQSGIPILIGGESKPALRRVARLGDGWLPYNLPVEDAPRVIGELKDMTRDAGRDPEALRIIKIVYSNFKLDDLKRYRDAGVTEFNISSSGEIPTDEAGIKAKFGEFAETIVAPIIAL